MPEVNLQNLTTLFTVLLVLEAILRRIAPLTKTDADDKALAEIDKAKGWAMTVAPSFYAVVESLAATGKIPKAEKAQTFLAELAEAYRKANGKPLPAEAHAEAEIVARGLAATDKIGNPPVASSK